MQLSNPVKQPLGALVSKAEKLVPHLSPFAIEGVGYHLAKSSLARGNFETDLQLSGVCAGLPVRTLVLLHAGLGLALAESVLCAMDERGSERAFLLERFAEVCRQHSRSGYTGVTFEALGLVARALYPHLIKHIDRNLSSNLTQLAYFWHGVGRGIYFAPGNVSPACSAPWKALAVCLNEPFHDLGRQNAMAGLAWAMTIINMEDPKILETFARHHGRQVMEDPAFMDGAGAATIFWQYVSPQVPANPEELFRYRAVSESA